MKQLGVVLACVSLLDAAPGLADPVRYLDRTIEREGVGLRLSIESVDEGAPLAPQAGQLVRIELEGRRLVDGQPLSNWTIGAWLDREVDALSGAVPVCRQRIARFLSGNVLDRPLVDLTGYYVLTLDEEASVSVLDPFVNFSGRSSLYASMKLQGRGFDWAKTDDDARLFVAIPEARKVAVADLHRFRVLDHVPLLGQPTRIALQPDQRLLWVGETGPGAAEQMVQVIDTVGGTVVADIPVPSGHHEFAFAEDGRLVYVTNRQSNTLTVIDAGTLTVVRTIALGFEPIGVVAVPSASSIWIVEGKAGRIHRWDMRANPVDIVQVEAGLGPAKVTPDGRFVLLVNPSQHRLYVFDADTGKERHRMTVSGQPYDLMFSAQYAYVRTLASEQVALLGLASLGTDHPSLQFIPAGGTALGATNGLPRASSMALAIDLAGAFFAVPAERTLYHYMEGMNAPDTGLRTSGHTPMATMVVRRGLREVGMGRYSSVIRLPSAGRLVLALAAESPLMKECVGFKVETGKQPKREAALEVEWVSDRVRTVVAGEPLEVRLRPRDAADEALARSSALRVRIVPSHGRGAVVWDLHASKDRPGEWAATGILDRSGSYYIHVEGNRPVESVYATVVVSDP